MRDDRIDILRFIGLAMIILAHVDPPGMLFQLRNFDVPLMILVSAMSFNLSYKADESYRAYLWKRIKRLVFPVWIFLTVYFTALWVIYPQSEELSFKTILTSYTLLEGIGYVWVIRVFLLVALVSPFISAWHKNVQSAHRYYSILAASILLYELLRYASLPSIQAGLGEITSSIVLYVFPYGVLFAIGLRIAQADKKHLYAIVFVSFSIFLLIGAGLFFINGEFIPTQSLKYPPSTYYFSYALCISSLLWANSEYMDVILEKIKIKNTVLFIARNSIWIYLWHIPLIKTVHMGAMSKYFIAFTGAVAVTYIQTQLVACLLTRVHDGGWRKNIKMVLTG